MKEFAAAVGDDSDTEVEQEFDEDEESLLLRNAARLKAEEAGLKELRLAKLRRANARREAKLAAWRAKIDDEDDDDLVDDLPVAGGLQTPGRVSLRPRALVFQAGSARSMRPPTAASLAHQAAIDQLPDIAPAAGPVSVAIAPAPAVVGNGRLSAPVVTTVIAPSTAAPPGRATPPAATSTPAESRGAYKKPENFTGVDTAQNEGVEQWVEQMDRFLRLSHVAADRHLDTARSYLGSEAGGAGEFATRTEEEVVYQGKQLTWEYLQAQLIDEYAEPLGVAALEVEWGGLKMGIPPVGGKDTGKAAGTFTVRAYTSRFLYLLRRVSPHTHAAQTTDVTIVQKYLRGIKDGYPNLYAMMLGMKAVLRPHSLHEAISAAQVGEEDLAIVRAEQRTTSSPSVWRSQRRQGVGPRAATESLNNLQGEYSDGELEVEEAPATKKKVQLHGFRFVTLPDDGRYKLTEKEQKLLYDKHLCYRCYGSHPVGRGAAPCTKPVQKASPSKLHLK